MAEENKETNKEESHGGTTLEDLAILIKQMKSDIDALKKDKDTLSTELANVRAVNTTLLTSTKNNTNTETENKELKDKFAKYLKGE